MAPGHTMDRFSRQAALCRLPFFLRAGAQAKGEVQRAEAHQAGQHEYPYQYQQYDPERTADDVGEEKHGDEGGDGHSDDPVDISHVLFHDSCFSVNELA